MLRHACVLRMLPVVGWRGQGHSAVMALRGPLASSCVRNALGVVAGPTPVNQRRHYGFLGKSASASPSASPDQTAAAAQAATDTTASFTAATPGQSVAGSPQTYFDYLDQFWNRQWFGTVDSGDAAGGVVAPVEAGAINPDALGWFTDAFLAVQHLLGLEAWATILLFGGLTRLFTLAFSFYGERASARMQVALPELQAPQDAFNKVYYNDLSSALDVQLSATALKSERRRVFAKHETSNAKCLASFASSPLLIYGLYQVSRLCENAVLDVGTSSFFWCTALTLPDPLFILPVVFCGLTLLNFELSISKEMKKGWMSNVIWGARLACLCVIPVAATFRAGVCLYFIGMSIVGLLQPILLRAPSFRRALKFPDTAEQTEAKKKLKDADELQARMTVQFPYLSHLLNPEVEDDNEQLFKTVTPPTARGGTGSRGSNRKGAPARGANVAPEGRRFVAGTNPLMRETPVSKQKRESAATQPPSSQTTAKKAPKATSGKGSSFASGGWKSAHVAFSEEDFTPASFEAERSTTPGQSQK